MPGPRLPRPLAALPVVAGLAAAGAWFGGGALGGGGAADLHAAPVADLTRLLELAKQSESLGVQLGGPAGQPSGGVGTVLAELRDRHGGSLADLSPADLRAAGIEAGELAEWMAAGATPGDEFTSGDAWAMAGNADGSVSPDDLLAGTADPEDASVRDIACAAELKILRTAVSLYEIDGTPPASVDDLMGDYLETRPSGWRISASGGAVTYEPIGECRRSAGSAG